MTQLLNNILAASCVIAGTLVISFVVFSKLNKTYTGIMNGITNDYIEALSECGNSYTRLVVKKKFEAEMYKFQSKGNYNDCMYRFYQQYNKL